MGIANFVAGALTAHNFGQRDVALALALAVSQSTRPRKRFIRTPMSAIDIDLFCATTSGSSRPLVFRDWKLEPSVSRSGVILGSTREISTRMFTRELRPSFRRLSAVAWFTNATSIRRFGSPKERKSETSTRHFLCPFRSFQAFWLR